MMKYRLPDIGDKDILQKYVKEHHDNGEAGVSSDYKEEWRSVDK